MIGNMCHYFRLSLSRKAGKASTQVRHAGEAPRSIRHEHQNRSKTMHHPKGCPIPWLLRDIALSYRPLVSLLKVCLQLHDLTRNGQVDTVEFGKRGCSDIALF